MNDSQLDDLKQYISRAILQSEANIKSDLTRDLTRNLTRDLTRNLTTDLTRNLTTDLTRNLTRDLTRNLTRDLTKDLTKELTSTLTNTLGGQIESLRTDMNNGFAAIAQIFTCLNDTVDSHEKRLTKLELRPI